MCEICIKGKLARLSFISQRKPRRRRIGELIYIAIAGSVTPISSEGFTYFQTITDDYSHFFKVYLLRRNAEAAEK